MDIGEGGKLGECLTETTNSKVSAASEKQVIMDTAYQGRTGELWLLPRLHIFTTSFLISFFTWLLFILSMQGQWQGNGWFSTWGHNSSMKSSTYCWTDVTCSRWKEMWHKNELDEEESYIIAFNIDASVQSL